MDVPSREQFAQFLQPFSARADYEEGRVYVIFGRQLLARRLLENNKTPAGTYRGIHPFGHVRAGCVDPSIESVEIARFILEHFIPDFRRASMVERIIASSWLT